MAIIVDFQSSTWTDSWFRKLPLPAKTFFLYSWTNQHKNLIAMYNIDFEIIAFETGLKINQIEDAIKILEGKVFYDREKEIIWVKNHVRHQFMRTANISPKIIEGISKCLISLNKHFFVGLFLKEYKELKIPYPYPIDTVSDRVSIYPSSVGEGEGEGKGESDGFSLKEKEDCKEEKENFLLTSKIVKRKFQVDKTFPPIKLTQEEYDTLSKKLKTHTRDYWIVQCQKYWHGRKHNLTDCNLAILNWDRKEYAKKGDVYIGANPNQRTQTQRIRDSRSTADDPSRPSDETATAKETKQKRIEQAKRLGLSEEAIKELE